MKEILTLVRGAVSTKDFLPVLTHFHIYNGRVQGSNGHIAIDAPCPELASLDCTVPAERFLKAVDACDGEPKFKLTEGGRLTITKGAFRAILPLAQHDSFPLVQPDKKRTAIKTPFLPILRSLIPFVGEDASRPWSCGILFKDGYAWATNNVVLARVPYKGLELLLPVFAINELLRIGQEPLSYVNADNWITLYFKEGWWMRVQKLEGQWPDIEKFFPDKCPKTGVKSPPLYEAVSKILPFCPDPKQPIIETGEKGVSTLDGEMSALVESKGLPVTHFRAEPLLTALQASDYIDLSTYPAPCYWRGNGIEGIIVGLRA